MLSTSLECENKELFLHWFMHISILGTYKRKHTLWRLPISELSVCAEQTSDQVCACVRVCVLVCVWVRKKLVVLAQQLWVKKLSKKSADVDLMTAEDNQHVQMASERMSERNLNS